MPRPWPQSCSPGRRPDAAESRCGWSPTYFTAARRWSSHTAWDEFPPPGSSVETSPPWSSDKRRYLGQSPQAADHAAALADAFDQQARDDDARGTVHSSPLSPCPKSSDSCGFAGVGAASLTDVVARADTCRWKKPWFFAGEPAAHRSQTSQLHGERGAYATVVSTGTLAKVRPGASRMWLPRGVGTVVHGVSSVTHEKTPKTAKSFELVVSRD